MPELPEVETVSKRLSSVLPGRIICSVKILRKVSFDGALQSLIGKQIQQVSRRAKLIRIHLPNKLNLLTHLKMTGQLIFIDQGKRVGGGHPTAAWVDALPTAHTRIIYQFTDGSTLYFNDMRVFGWMKLMTDDQVLEHYSHYGPDALGDDKLTLEYLQQQLNKRRMSIKQTIMQNQIMAGIGNIYASEVLNVAHILPFRSANSLSTFEIRSLLFAVKQVLKAALKHGGTTFDGKYVDVGGLSGSYQFKLQVYGKAGKQCGQCGEKIIKKQLGGRGSYYCGSCQK